MNNVIDILSQFTTVVSWLGSTIYNVLVNITTYVNQLMVVISLLPEFVQYSAVAGIALIFAYMIIHWLI